VFLASAGLPTPSNGVRACFVYELDLTRKELRQLVQTPASRNFGAFVVSSQGTAYATYYAQDQRVPTGLQDEGPQWAWLYCEGRQASQSTAFPSAPSRSLILGEHFFFDFDGQILHYDMPKGTKEFLQIPGASRWQRERLQFMHAHEGKTNELHFEYFRRGTRLAEGRDYDSATCFVFDVGTGEYRPVAGFGDLAEDEFRTYDGRSVWFAGPGSPLAGTELMCSTTRTAQAAPTEETEGGAPRLLRKFGNPRVGGYVLAQMSPCRHYALVLQKHQGSVLNPKGYHEWTTYHVVNATTGESWVLLQDEVERKTGGFMSEVKWVPSRLTKP
jgi:hypothetical protein